MDHPPDPHAKAALQHLIWALQEIEKADNEEAAQCAREAIDALRRQVADRSAGKGIANAGPSHGASVLVPKDTK
jgi:hypothetical protein